MGFFFLQICTVSWKITWVSQVPLMAWDWCPRKQNRRKGRDCLECHSGCSAAHLCLILWDPMDCSMGFSRQEYWSGLLFPTPGDLPRPGIKAVSPALASGFFTTEPPGKPCHSGTLVLIATLDRFIFCQRDVSTLAPLGTASPAHDLLYGS